MASRLSYRFEPLADLYFLLTDPRRCPSTQRWRPARDAVAQCVELIAASPGGRRRADMAFHGHIAEHSTIDELASAEVPDDGLLGLPWSKLVGLAIEALRAAEPVYASECADDRAAVALDAIEHRVRPVLGPREAECIAFIHDALALTDDDRDVPIVLAASVPSLPFTALSDRTGAICFIGVDGLDGTSLIETILHEATHGFEYLSSTSETSVLARLGRKVRQTFGDDPRFGQVPHSMIFVTAAEAVRRIVDPGHVHYGVTHTYYDRVPVSKPVLEQWVAHLDGRFDAETAIERLVDDLRATGGA